MLTALWLAIISLWNSVQLGWTPDLTFGIVLGTILVILAFAGSTPRVRW